MPVAPPTPSTPPTPPTPRAILHVDMDAFYAAVEQRDNPLLRGKPVLVGGRGKRGVVTTASYEARPFGCRSAMPMGQALRLCPHAIVVPGRMSVYVEVSRQVRTILDTFTPDVQPISIDEAFMDVTLVRHLHGDAATIAAAVRKRIKDELQLTASVGIGPNKFLAKVASDMCKPDGVREIRAEDAAAVLEPMPVTVIYGVGPEAGKKLAKLSIKTVGDLRRLGENELARHVGERTAALWSRLALGEDDRAVHSDRTAKSIGKERTFGEDIGNPDQLRSLLLGFVEDVARSLRDEELLCRRVTLKLRTGDFSTFTRSETLARPTDQTSDLWAAASPLLEQWISERHDPLRLLGVSLHEIESERQLDLFADGKKAILDNVADGIIERFGRGAIQRAGALEGRKDRAGAGLTKNARARSDDAQ